MDIKVRGIVLKASDYKDDDKLLRLYTLEQGKIGAVMRGVKKAKARLKIASQIFCFGEYLLTGGEACLPSRAVRSRNPFFRFLPTPINSPPPPRLWK